VYSVHNEDSVQVICMPYLGRVTIADLIRAYRAENPSGRRSTSVRAARTTSVDSKNKPNSRFGSDSKNSRSGTSRVPTWSWETEAPPPIIGDPVAVLQVISQLAAGLSHAHERGILHLDLKPANVLLADTGEPMLLDFNLSFDASSPKRELIGGTVPYMAIEQLVDMRKRKQGDVDQRTDLYALGVMAFEMLTGTVLFPTTAKKMRDFDEMIEVRRKGPPSIRELNPTVTPAVEAIVRKMLAPEAADRYQSAEDLREDIERHLNDQPLAHAREASTRERFSKWRRRNPRLLLRLMIACLVVSALGLSGFAYQLSNAKARVEAVKQAEATRDALDTVRLDLILPNDAHSRARGVKKATELLAAYDLPGDTNWQNQRGVQRLSEAERTALASDLGELMTLLAQAKWHEAESRPESERNELIAEAWKLNVAARACFTNETVPPLLNQQAALLAPAAGKSYTLSPARQPVNTRGFFLDAVSMMSSGRYSHAIPLFDRVVSAQPQHATAHYCLAFCLHQKGEYVRALERYDVARVLLRDDPRPAHQRGMIHGVNKQPELAEEEFTKSLAIDPDYVDAYRHRAVSRYRIAVNESTRKGRERIATKKLEEAEADLSAALERGASPQFVYFVRAQIRDRRGDHAGADADRDALRHFALKTEEDFVASGWSRMDRDPKGAAENFQKAIELNPRSIVALQNLVHLLVNQLNNNDKALVVATQLTERYPEFVPAIAGRAVVLARLGRREEAHKEIERARLMSDDAEILYLAASVYALTSKTNVEDIPKAAELIRKAWQKGYVNLRGMETDPNLDAIRNNAEFRDISRAAATIHR
jgi:tetratricopeptide (TPR) repeat protein